MPPILVVGVPLNPVIGVTVPAGIVVDPTGIGVGGTPTVPLGIAVPIGAVVI